MVFAPRAGSITESAVLSRKIFDAAARRNLHLAVAQLPVEFFEESLRGMKQDQETLLCLRSVLMKPEHRDWIDRIWQILSESAREILGC